MDLGKSIQQALTCHIASNVSSSDFERKLGTVPEYWTIPNRKRYERMEKVKLGHGRQLSLLLSEALHNRASTRRFVESVGTLNDLEAICSHSLKQSESLTTGIRPYPSAGARYPCEIYFAARNMNGLDNGLYHYDAVEHSLAKLIEGDFLSVLRLSSAIEDPGEPNLLVIISAVLPRTMAKYGGRGYRYTLIEVGAIMQNLALVGGALGYGSYLIGGFFDRSISSYIDIMWDLELEAPLLLMVLGKPGENSGEELA